MTTKEQLSYLMSLGVSVAKLGEPLHRTTLYKWISGERNLSPEKEQIIRENIQSFLDKLEIVKEEKQDD